MFRLATRSAAVARVGLRGYATAAGEDFVAQRAAVKAHAAKTTALWRNVSFYVCVPVALLGTWWTYGLEKDHEKHLDHIRHENGGELPAPPAYEYLNIRVKPFPWGMQSLFFNPEVNTKVE